MSSLSEVDLPAPFGPMMPERLAGLHFERHVLQRPELFGVERVAVRARRNGTLDERRRRILETVVPLAAAELLPHSIEDDGGLAHGMCKT